MSLDQRIAVLKFGGSILKTVDDLTSVTQEIYRWRRDGYLVVAVVSAIGDTTDRLYRQALMTGPSPDPAKTAILLATGELHCAALLGLALDAAGITSVTCDDVEAGLQTSADPLDACPTGVDEPVLRQRLAQYGVVVLPGFLGRSDQGRQCLLGRGGSDLTAMFIARQLDATNCRLVKDVPGLFEFDPKSSGNTPRRFETIDYRDALQLDEAIVQHKGIRYARTNGLSFEVGPLGGLPGTVVGGVGNSTLIRDDPPCRPLRIGMIGNGTVGFGVFNQIQNGLLHQLEITKVAVRNLDKAIAGGVPENQLTSDIDEIIDSDCDVVVELAGGQDLPERWITAALQKGKHVVTANKSVMASSGSRLQSIADTLGVSLGFSAAVGGSAPVLESIRNLVADGHRIASIAGVLNGSTNYILDRAGNGSTFDQAVRDARQLGLTETDPQRDLDGRDAADKLVLLARACGYELPHYQITREPITASCVDSACSTGYRLRQIARLSINDSKPVARVGLEKVSCNHPFGRVIEAGNLVELTIETGQIYRVAGIGAGRGPTTSSVIADLLDLYRLRLLRDAKKPEPGAQSELCDVDSANRRELISALL